MARLKRRLDSASSTQDQHIDLRPKSCYCLRQYTDCLRQLQTIETFQQPVEADTLLTCTDLAIKLTEKQCKCEVCLYDSRVLMQPIMIFQTIVTWTQDCRRVSNSSVQDLSMMIGRHELATEERELVTRVLMTRAMSRIQTILQTVGSRIDYVLSEQHQKQPFTSERAEFCNLQQLTASLIQRARRTISKLASQHCRLHDRKSWEP